MNDCVMIGVCVLLTTLSDGVEETLNGTGFYKYEKTRFAIEFEADDASFGIYSDKSLRIVRKGDVSYELHLCAGELTDCRLNTPYGNISAALRTDKLQTFFSRTRAEVHAEYALFVGGGCSARSLHVSVLPVSESKYTGEIEV